MYKRTDYESFKKRALKNPKVKEAYEALRTEFELMIAFIEARKAANISQEDLAKKLKVQQPSVARLERGGYTKTSVTNLAKVANALGYSLKFSLEAKK